MMITIDAPFDIQATTHIADTGALIVELTSLRGELVNALGLLYRQDGDNWCLLGEVRLSGTPVATQLHNYRSAPMRLEITQATFRRAKAGLLTSDCPETVMMLVSRLGETHPFWSRLVERFGQAGLIHLDRLLGRSHVSLRSEAEVLAQLELELAREALPERLRAQDDTLASARARIDAIAAGIEFAAPVCKACPSAFERKSA